MPEFQLTSREKNFQYKTRKSNEEEKKTETCDLYNSLCDSLERLFGMTLGHTLSNEQKLDNIIGMCRASKWKCMKMCHLATLGWNGLNHKTIYSKNLHLRCLTGFLISLWKINMESIYIMLQRACTTLLRSFY